MVLIKNLSGKIASTAVLACLFNFLLVALACLPAGACRPTQAGDIAGEPECRRRELEIDEKQMSNIKDSIRRFFQWEAYWTYTDQQRRAFYDEKSNKRFSILVFSLSHGLIVFVPDMENSVLTFRKSPDGNISGPRSVKSGPSFTRDFEGDNLLVIAKALGNWREFILLTGREIEKEPYGIPLLIPEEEMRRYIDRNRDSMKYCQVQSEINLLPRTPVTYDPMDKKKEALLEAIGEASIDLARMMFIKGVGVTITIPNFNINDGGIWVLIENSHREAYTMGMSIDVTKTDTPVTYVGTVEIRRNPKYGIRIGADEKIRQAAIKTLSYKIE
ncbi:MAG: hypothetical protein AABN34_08035 [Acidobacteriota bacterium]